MLRSIIKGLLIALLSNILLSSPISAFQRTISAARKVAQTDWDGIRGVNYIP